MVKYITYLWYVVRHRWFVMVECFQRGMIWQGLVHDVDKFLPDEFFAYADFFAHKRRDKTGYYKPTNTGHSEFDRAWLRHVHRNRHHWQHWCIPDDSAGVKPFDIPLKYIREMVCDWIGAGRAQHSEINATQWFAVNGHKMQLTDSTRRAIEEELAFYH